MIFIDFEMFLVCAMKKYHGLCGFLKEKKLKRSVFEIEAYLTARTEKDKDYADQYAQDKVVSILYHTLVPST
jgi:hypothetical protein